MMPSDALRVFFKKNQQPTTKKNPHKVVFKKNKIIFKNTIYVTKSKTVPFPRGNLQVNRLSAKKTNQTKKTTKPQNPIEMQKSQYLYHNIPTTNAFSQY